MPITVLRKLGNLHSRTRSGTQYFLLLIRFILIRGAGRSIHRWNFSIKVEVTSLIYIPDYVKVRILMTGGERIRGKFRPRHRNMPGEGKARGRFMKSCNNRLDHI